jgi:hypothetical protein
MGEIHVRDLWALREIRRDMLYRRYGEDWRAHEVGNFWTEGPSEVEKEILEKLAMSINGSDEDYVEAH